MDQLTINRAPVLTLWAAVVAKRLGYSRDEALTLGRAVAGLNAYSKGKALGLFRPTPVGIKRERAAKGRRAGARRVELLHRVVPVVHTPDGWRAAVKGKPISPASVKKYLESKFKGALGAVSSAMAVLARSRKPAELARDAYALYEKFRPAIPAGKTGWGAAGVLHLKKIRALAR
jgi:hypothetical protein